VGHFLCGWPSSAPTPAHLHARAGLPARYRVSLADRRGPPISTLLTQIFPHLLACVATPAKLLVTGQPPVTTPCHKNAHVCAYRLEPSCQLQCIVVSHHCCPLLYCCPSLLHPGCPPQELDDEASCRLPRWPS
jgi:hypothetical protein